MTRKLALLCATFVLAGLACVPTANAGSRMLKVFWDYNITGLCRPQPDQVRFRLDYFVKIQRRHSPKPKNVIVRYAIMDGATGSTLIAGKLVLNDANGWHAATTPVLAAEGQALAYTTNLSYRGPLSGRTIYAEGDDPDKVPLANEMDQANTDNPDAPPFPACV